MTENSGHCTGYGDQNYSHEKEMQKGKMEKKKKAKWLSEEALQIAEKRREVKSKGEKERYTHLNAEFQRIARRDKKVSEVAQLCPTLCDPMDCSPWNSLGKSTGVGCHFLLQGIFLTQGSNPVSRIAGRGFTSEPAGKQEHTENYTKKDLYDPDHHDGEVTHLEPDIPECEVRWALGSITTSKARGGDGIPAELFQILKDYAV